MFAIQAISLLLFFPTYRYCDHLTQEILYLAFYSACFPRDALHRWRAKEQFSPIFRVP